MYAIIETGGKQYKVEKDDLVQVEKLDGKVKDEIIFSNVLLTVEEEKVRVGFPYLEGAKVIAEKLGDFKAKKVTSFKFRRRKNSKTLKGHRQQLASLRIKEIVVD